MSDAVICLERKKSTSVIEVPDVTTIVTTVLSVLMLIIIIISVTILVYYLIKKQIVTKSGRVVPTALIAAAMGRVSPFPVSML